MPARYGGNRNKLLVIDDNEAFLEEFAESLRSAGYDVEATTDGSHILELTAKDRPDLILIELKMQSISGFEVASAVKYDPQISGTPIIAMSAFYDMKEKDFLSTICGVNRFLKKPFNFPEAIRQIEDILKERPILSNEKEDTGNR